MTDFWLAAGLLLLVALAVLLIPVLRGRRAQAGEDRTALNVALYQERIAELEGEQRAGVLNQAQLEAGRAEAARELLADTEGADLAPVSRLGRALPLLAALLVPLLGLGLYLHWGASDQVALTRELAQAPASVEEMTARLERVVEAQPDSAEGWYFLGRTYMAQERPAEAAPAFERAANLAGRQPAVLGQWAQALYFANGRQWSAELQALADEALEGDPSEVTSLGLLGIAAFEEKRYAEAVRYWERLIALLPPDDPSRGAIEGGVARAREQLGDQAPAPAPASVGLSVRVELDEALRDKVRPDDSVFIFVRAVDGPPMPLAAKRLTVAELPVEVRLGDTDAMLPQLKLSAFPRVQLMARISRAGNATAGEWVAHGQPLANDERALQTLTIDRPDE